MRYSVDRIEENIAVCENLINGEIIKIDLLKLPKGIKDGDIIVNKNGKYELDEEYQRKRKEEIQNRIEKLWKE